MDNYYVLICKLDDDSVIEKMGPMTERKADRVYDGASINLNHDKFCVVIKEEGELTSR